LCTRLVHNCQRFGFSSGHQESDLRQFPLSCPHPEDESINAERFDQALDQAAQSGKFDPWLKKVDADIDAGRVKPLNVWRQARSAARLACYQAI